MALSPSFMRSELATPRVSEAPAGFLPTRVLDIEISEAIRAVAAIDDESGLRYGRAAILVRLHTRPLGVVTVDLGADGASADALVALIWKELGPAIKAHLAEDELSAAELTTTGLLSNATPKCLLARARLLAEAPQISVVIATHDRGPAIVRTLESLRALEYPRFETIIVDNAPSDNTTVDLIASQYTEMRYVREEHAGLAVAHNRGLLEVKTPFVAFTDDDVKVDRHWLTEIASAFAASSDVGCVTGMILPAELRTPAQLMIEQYGYSKGFSRRVFDLRGNRPPGALYPYAAGVFGSGANMAFRTAAIKAVGGFDPALGAGSLAKGGDDLAGFFSIVTAGYKLVYEPAAILRHWHRREYASLQKQAFGYGVGLTAYLASVIVHKPIRLLDIALKAPSGILHAIRMRTGSPEQRSHYPVELARIERCGMLSGPGLYIRSRRRYAQWRRVNRAARESIASQYSRVNSGVE